MNHVWGYLAKPLKQAAVVMLLKRALQREFDQDQTLPSEAGPTEKPAEV